MIGRTISHYKITAKLGEGGMGVVYKATDGKLERTVALKFLARHMLSNEEAKRRFVREAKAAAALDHPNICTVHEIDEVDGETFIAMAFLEGRTLADAIAAGPLKLRDVIDITMQTAKGLHEAHGKGIFDRDIKPSNMVLIEKNAKDRLVKIMDFGLAHLTDRSKLTEENTTLGTPACMSPEQAKGIPTDHRTDIWALGVVLAAASLGQVHRAPTKWSSATSLSPANIRRPFAAASRLPTLDFFAAPSVPLPGTNSTRRRDLPTRLAQMPAGATHNCHKRRTARPMTGSTTRSARVGLPEPTLGK